MYAQIKEAFVENMSAIGLQGIRKNDLVILKLEGKKSANGSIILLLLNAVDRLPVGLVKIPRNPKCFTHLESECKSIENLHKLIHDNEITNAVPGGCIVKDIGMRKVIIQSACAGSPMVRSVDPDNVDGAAALFRRVFGWSLRFHLAISEKVMLDDIYIQKYMVEPVEWLKINMPDAYSKLSEKSKIHFEKLPEYSRGRSVMLVHQHGDFNLYNLLSGVDGSERFSVIDWEDYKEKSLPVHDINHFFVTGANLLDKQDAVGSFKSLLGEAGWYKELYNEVVQAYADSNVFEKDFFYLISPLYFIEMIKHVTNDVRQEEHTHEVLLDLCNLYIESFC